MWELEGQQMLRVKGWMYAIQENRLVVVNQLKVLPGLRMKTLSEPIN